MQLTCNEIVAAEISVKTTGAIDSAHTCVEGAECLCMLRNANVSYEAVVRNKVIRPPAPWVEPLAAAPLSLI